MSKSEEPRNPMVGSFPACRALAASGHAAAPLSSVMNSRRFIRQPRWQAVGDVRAYRRIARLAAAGVLHCGISTRLMTASGQNSVVPVMFAARPLFPRKRKSNCDLAMQAVTVSPTACLSDAHPRSFPLVTVVQEPLGLQCRESRGDQFDHHIDGETLGEHDRLGAAVRARGEAFEGATG